MTAPAVIAVHVGGAEMVGAAALHLKRMYAFAPFASCPPVPAALVALVSLLAPGSESIGYWVVAVTAWLAAGWAASNLARRANAPNAAPWFAAAVLLFAPSRMWMLFIVPDLPRLLFWSAAAFIPATLIARRKTNAASVARMACLIPLAAGSHPLSVNTVDILAAVELAVLVLVCTRVRDTLRWLAPAAAAISLTAAFWHYSVQPYYRFDPGPPPSELQSWLAAKSSNRRIFRNQASLGLIEQPGLSLATETIQSPSSAHESLLWLRAFAAEYLVSADWLKYRSRLDPVFESGEWFVYRLPAPNPAEAVLVSLPGWTRLPEIRGLRDDEALAAYLDWSGRPEQAGIAWSNPRDATITADLGEFDAILVRRAAAPGWHATLVAANGDESEFPVGSDPLGYIVLAPRVEGPARIRIRYQPGLIERFWPSRPRARELFIGGFPAISPNGIVDSSTYAPPPFPPGAVISIFGRGFIDGATRVLLDGQSVVPLYTGPNQINVRLPESLPPGKVEIIVEVGGAPSTPYEIEVAP